MLIFTDYRPNDSCSTSNLLDVYVRYKQDTRAVIAWLVSHGSKKYKNMPTLSIGDLFGLAEVVQSKAVEMPEIIDFHFREAIAARTQLSKVFRKVNDQSHLDEETFNHEFFTASLNKIYTGLCECCAKPKNSCKNMRRTGNNEDRALERLNRFAVLRLSCSENESLAQKKPQNEPTTNIEDDREDKIPSLPNPTPELVNDVLMEAFEIRKEVEEMSELLCATKNAWEQAAQGKSPIAVAAFITNVAFAAFEKVETQLKVSCGPLDPESLYQKVLQTQEDSASLGQDHGASRSTTNQLLEALRQSWLSLLDIKDDGPAKQLEKTVSMANSPSQVVLQKETNSGALNTECFKVMLQNIAQRIQGSYLHNGVIRLGTPVYAEVGYFLTHKQLDNNGLRCCYGLQLLLAAYRSYLFGSDSACAPSSCRIAALKFAQEIIPNVSAVLDDSTMPCRCTGTLAYHLENLYVDLKNFLQIRLFDFYFQSPWVCGSQILEMLEASSFYGLRLFSYRNYIGALLHVYNVLRQFATLQKVPLLETLCDKFRDIFFPGGRPYRNFRACYIRHMGGRLKFSSDKSGHKSGCHQMVIPAHTAKATAGFGLRKEACDPRFEYRKISLLFHIKEKGYHLDDALWHRVSSVNHTQEHEISQVDTKRRSCSFHNHLQYDLPECSSQTRLRSLENAVLTEFSGPFPIAKINFFKVYISCVRIISIISDKYHGDDARPGQNCLCFADAILLAADRYKDNEHKYEPFRCRDLVRLCQDTIKEALGDVNLEEFLWDGI